MIEKHQVKTFFSHFFRRVSMMIADKTPIPTGGMKAPKAKAAQSKKNIPQLRKELINNIAAPRAKIVAETGDHFEYLVVGSSSNNDMG